jgi:hypothetical protein
VVSGDWIHFSSLIVGGLIGFLALRFALFATRFASHIARIRSIGEGLGGTGLIPASWMGGMKISLPLMYYCEEFGFARQ